MAVKGSAQKSEFYDHLNFIHLFYFLIIKYYNAVSATVVSYDTVTVLAYLSDQVLYEFLHGEGDVGVDAVHLTQLVLVLCGLQVTVQ